MDHETIRMLERALIGLENARFANQVADDLARSAARYDRIREELAVGQRCLKDVKAILVDLRWKDTEYSARQMKQRGG